MNWILFVSVFVVATCGLIYELVAGTLASYLLGDSVTQFSTIIGAYLSAMGLGSFLSRYCKFNLLETFVRIELVLALLGGTSAALLFSIFSLVSAFRPVLYSVVFMIGILVGFEIPLLLRILHDRVEFSDLVSRVLSFDYIGALAASLLFPLILAPQLGLVRTAFMFGMLNCLVAIWVILAFGNKLHGARSFRWSAAAVFSILTVGFVLSDKMVAFAETAAYAEPVIYAESSKYQRLVVTKRDSELRLYLNGALQFSSLDEYRYHEALVHPALAALKNPRRVLILGGGDGMAAREALRYPEVAEIVLIDLDPAVTDLFSSSELMQKLNGSALRNPKVKVVNIDAFEWLRQQRDNTFDLVIIDLPDPTSFSLGKLYSTSFYRELQKVMGPDSLAVVQSTSPLLARKSFWCVNNTLRAVGFETVPYHAHVASFGEWGFILFGRNQIPLPQKFPENLRFVSLKGFELMRFFPQDMEYVATEINQLNNQALVNYYEHEWSTYGA